MNKKIVILISLWFSISMEAEDIYDPLPLNAKSGQCFTKAFYPPQFTKVRRVNSTKKVLTREDSFRYDVVPAEYEWSKQRIKISDGSEKIITTPAVYKTIYERVLVESPSKVWREGLAVHDRKAFNSCVQSAKLSGMDIENASLGTCFYEHSKPAFYSSVTSKILASEASERLVVKPARYQTEIAKIVVDATDKRLLPSKPIYKKIPEKVIVAPTRTEWRKTTCTNRGCNQSEVVCLVEVPVKYKKIIKRKVLQGAVAQTVAIKPLFKTVAIKRMVTPASVHSVPVPAVYKSVVKKEKIEDEYFFWSDARGKNNRSRIRSECNKICLTQEPPKYKTVAKKVLVTPATSRLVKTPPQYASVKVKKILKEASFKKVMIPKEYITVVVERERTKGYARWIPIMCESSMTPSVIQKVQKALQTQGFYHGEIDGVWSIEAKSSARAYQKERGLARTSKLSIETMKSLGVY